MKQSNTVHISSGNKNESERMIAIIALGILEALQNKAINFTEAERCLFGPYGKGILENLELSQETIDLVNSASALEDLEDIFTSNPEQAVKKEINTLKRQFITILESTEFDPYEHKYWLDY